MLSEASGPSYSVPSLVKAQNLIGANAELWSVEHTNVPETRHNFHRAFDAINHVPILRQAGFSPSLNQSLRACDADIFHTHGLWLMPNVEPIRQRRQKPSKFVLTVRGMLSPAAFQFSKSKKVLFWHLLQKHAVAEASFLHATAMSELAEIRQFGLTNPVAVIPNGIDIPATSSQPAKDGRKTVLSLGRLHPKKNLIHLVSMWSTLEQEFEDWDLRIIGPDENGYRSKVLAHAEQLGVKRLTIEPPLFGDEKTCAYQSAELFVLPSLNENFGLTVSEALAAGTPVISSKGAPWSGLINHGCGWWVPLADNGFEMAMRSAMAKSCAERKKMGRQGQAWMLRDFGWEAIANQMILAYKWALGDEERPDFIYD